MAHLAPSYLIVCIWQDTHVGALTVEETLVMAAQLSVPMFMPNREDYIA